MSAVDKTEVSVGVVGLGLLGYVVYRVSNAGSGLFAAAAGAVDAAGQAVDAGLAGGLGSAVDAWENPACNDPNDPQCAKKVPTKHPGLDEHGNALPLAPVALADLVGDL